MSNDDSNIASRPPPKRRPQRHRDVKRLWRKLGSGYSLKAWARAFAKTEPSKRTRLVTEWLRSK